MITHNTCLIGKQQFLLGKDNTSTGSQVQIYFRSANEKDLELAMKKISAYLQESFPEALYQFEDAGNIFEILFSETQAPLLVRLRATRDYGPTYTKLLQEAVNEVSSISKARVDPIPWQEQILLKADKEMLLLYEIDPGQVIWALRNALSENQVMLISGNQNFIPVVIGESQKTLEEIINTSSVINAKGKEINLAGFFTIEKEFGLKSIIAGEEGEYYPIALDIPGKEVIPLSKEIRNTLLEKGIFEAGFSGSWFSDREMIKSLSTILLISLLLLYFILASQFESLVLPLLVLMEVPIDIFGAFLLLKIFGGSINLMSLIGIVVMSGIVINDSILKVDTINKLHRSGTPLMKALVLGGKRRLKPILMTSLTTVLALLPFLFISGIGSDMQKPLALAVMGGMIIGTAVSLFIVPLGYYYLRK